MEVHIKIWNCRGCVSVIPIVIGAFGTMSKHLYCKGVDQYAGNAWVHCITPESLFVGNREDPKNDPRHLRLKGDRLILWGIRPGIV